MRWDGRTYRASVRIERIESACPPGALIAPLAEQDDPVVLDSSALHETLGRYTVLACRPVEIITLREGVLSTRAGEVLSDADDESLWKALAEAFGKVLASRPGAECSYLPGWFGYVGYEVARHVERLPARAKRDTHLPDLRLAFYDAVLVYDAIERSWSLVSLEFDDPPQGAGLAAEVLRDLAARSRDDSEHPPPAPADLADARPRPAVPAQPNFSPDEYRRAVARCVEYIAAGDVFQVCLSQRFTVADAPDPLAIYRSLRRRNPAWYAAYLSFDSPAGRCAVLSSSPELFLRVRDGRVMTRPIKGTRPRVGEAGRDRAAAAELLASGKDNAELAMIIDLLRNDIGRVCRFGSVRVAEPCRLETHPTVFHLVGTVVGELREGVGPAELLRAAFPGGSITGAPKIRAMEIIDELEPTARSVYTGCVGTVGVDGSCEWNIAIRTIICDAGAALVQVGGGIVADSSPDAEYQETLDKARAMLEAIEEAGRRE